MLDKPLCFVDVETTGSNAINGRIIEIGILKVYKDKLVKKYESLVNPGLRIDPFVEKMTGISSQALEYAPSFFDIKDEIYEILGESIFIAHNVRFDYSFIRNEFRRYGMSFKSRHFDTVKLARTLYPGFTRYNLDSIIQRHNIKIINRHRAFGDAKALWDFFKLSKRNIDKEIFNQALSKVLKKPTLPSSITQDVIDKLPENPGVYIFYGEGSTPLYVGKSVNIRERVLSHFVSGSESSTDVKIAQGIKSVETVETAGELSALLLESSLIKKMKPIYNKALRSSLSTVVAVRVTKNGYHSIKVVKNKDVKVENIKNIIGVYKNEKQFKDILHELCKENAMCTKLMGLSKDSGACFNYQLGRCLGACIGKENFLRYNLRFDEAFYKKKIKPWRFDKPVIIKEIGDTKEAHLVDRWCYIGNIKDESQGLSETDFNHQFDYDIYKILKRYLGNPHNYKNISPYTFGKKSSKEPELW